jgi:hypothetical protein
MMVAMRGMLPNIFTIKTAQGPLNVLSFLPPEYVFAKGIPEEAIVGVLPPDVTKIALPAFKSGSAFIRFLHRVIAKHAPNLPALQEEARRIGNGSLFIVDGRAPTPEDRVEPEDIIGAFQVSAGIILPDTYRASTKHLLVGKHGFLLLDELLQQKLLDELLLLGKSAPDI